MAPSLLARSAGYIYNKASSLAQGPAIAIARPAILSLLSSIEVGTLILIDEPYGERHVFGQSLDDDDNASTTTTPGDPSQRTTPPRVTLTITSPTFYPRLLLLSDMGFAQSYFLHEVTCSDLTSFFRLFILNRDNLSSGATPTGSGSSWWSSTLARAAGSLSSLLLAAQSTTKTNTTDGAALNIAAHYDISNEMFAAFLSSDMTYSCPIWGEYTNAIWDRTAHQETLEAAQMRKLHRFITGARIKAADHVLEIGTGWGSFAIEAVKRTGCCVTTLTLSREQKVWAEERIAREGLAGRIEVLLADYRDAALPVPEGGYDKVVSIEMLEAVGREFLGTYFARVHRLLKRDGGVAMFQCVTMPEGRHGAYERREDFINRYIFPGGYLPSITQLLNHITAESKGTLIVQKVENIGGHYTRTLRLWRERFLANFDDKIQPALMKEHPDMTKDEVDVFRRKWEYYFSYCEAGFLTKTLGDVIITVGREGAMELMEGIPL